MPIQLSSGTATGRLHGQRFRRLWPVIVAIIGLLTACVSPTSRTPVSTAPPLTMAPSGAGSTENSDIASVPGAIADSDRPAAEVVLRDFLDDLSAGDYDHAALAYAGSYATLIEWNPNGIASEDHAGLLKAGCEINGLQCLPVRTIEPAGRSEMGLAFTVAFSTRDGALFVRGPCCGGDTTDQPPVSDFTYTVVKIDGQYRVLELPPYVP